MILEPNSTTTFENIREVKRLLANVPGRRVLMTSDYHMRRSLAVARAMNFDVEPMPAPELMDLYKWHLQRWRIAIVLLQESAKFVYDAGKGRT